MRSVLARLALTGLVGTALVGCGSGGQSLPTGAIPNNSGGGSINVGSQNPPGADIAGVLIDGGDYAGRWVVSRYMPSNALEVEPPAPHEVLPALERTLEQRSLERPAGSYTVALLDDPPRIGEKVMEEAEEAARAAREFTCLNRSVCGL